MRVLVYGGRDFRDRGAVFAALDRLRAERGDFVVVQGAADGADRWAAEWGWERGMGVCSFAADWETHGRKAGPIRNQEMLDSGVDGAVEFPGGRGTADMRRRLEAAGVGIWRPCDRP